MYWLIVFIVVLFTIITIRYYYKKDIYEPEPFKQIIIAYIYGMISTIPAIILSLILVAIIGNDTLFSSVIIAPLIEESTKAFFVLLLARNKNFDGPLDGLIYGAMVGTGFASVEDILYGIEQANIATGIMVVTIRSITMILGHPLYTGITGAGIGAAKIGYTHKKLSRISLAMVLHALWNWSASVSFLYSIIMVIVSIFILRTELKSAIEIDRQMYQSGYFYRKYLFGDMPPPEY